MGYAELLKRKLTRDTSEHHAADIIVREAERMADIVRKIGKITRYETKSYVGRSRSSTWTRHRIRTTRRRDPESEGRVADRSSIEDGPDDAQVTASESSPPRVSRTIAARRGQATDAADGAGMPEDGVSGVMESAGFEGRRTTERPVPRLPTPSPDQVLGTLLDLSRQVSLEMHDEEIAHAYSDAFRSLFPHRLFVIRLVKPETGRLSLVYATGRLRSDRRDLTEVSRDALERHRIAMEDVAHLGIVAIDAYTPVFAEGAHGFDIPMMDGSSMVGVLDVEYPPGAVPPPTTGRS